MLTLDVSKVAGARRRLVLAFLGGLAAISAAIAVAAQPPHAELVVDLNEADHVVGSSPRGFWPVGDTLYLEAAGALWRTDGTVGGTVPVLEQAQIEDAAAVGGRLVFSRRASRYGITGGPVNQPLPVEVWATDGTPEGTELLIDGLALAFGAVLESFDGGVLVTAALGPSAATGVGLWRTDGTRSGTTLLARFEFGGVALTRADPGPLTSAGAWVYFGAGSLEVSGSLLHRSDGTASGTKLVFDLPLGAGELAGKTIVWSGQELLFFAGNESGGLRLWRTQTGSDAVSLVRDLAPGDPQTAVSAVAGGGGNAYFLVQASSPDPRCELWMSDGTALGTRHLYSTDLVGASCPDRLLLVGERVFFSAHDDLISSGPMPGTVSVVDGGTVGLPLDYDALSFEDRLVFVRPWGDTRHYFVFATDGSPGDLQTLATVPFTPQGEAPELGVFDGHIYLTGWDAEAGRELWRSDGTPAGTHRFADLVGEGASSSPEQSRRWGNRVAFVAREADGVRRAFATDGTASGTERVSTTPDPVSGILGVAGDSLVLSSSSSDFLGCRYYGATLDSSTQLLIEDLQSCSLEQGGEVGDRVLFRAFTDAIGLEPWVTDGTPEGTLPLGDLYPGGSVTPSGSFFPKGSSPDFPTLVGDFLYFRAYLSEGSSLWRTKGTPATTERIVLVADSLPTHLTTVGPLLFYQLAVDGQSNLFVHHSILGSVQRVEAEGLDTSSVVATASFRGRLAQIRRESEGTGRSLWLSDGTNDGTRRVLEIPLATVGRPDTVAAFFGQPITRTGDRLYFVAQTPETGWELWTTNGTETGTHLLRDINPGPESSEPADLRVVDGFLVFSAISPEEGRELWRSDGTEEGTVLLAAVEPGPRGSHPSDAVALGDRILFSAKRSDTGRELFAIDRLALQRPCRADASTLCLHDRFEVSVDWLAPQTGAHGRASAVPFTDESGAFWFFDRENVELVVKILDGTALTDHFWLYYGALSDVSYWITVVDSQTGITRTYHNPPGNLCGLGDVSALPPERGLDPGPEVREGGRAQPSLPQPVSSQVPPNGSCAPGDGVACLGDGRFQVEVRFRSPGAGAPLPAATLPGTDDTAYFWFFDAGNVELAVKVLDGESVNGQSWVLYGALSDVEYTVRVTETATGLVREYHNPQGSLCGRADVDAFPVRWGSGSAL